MPELTGRRVAVTGASGFIGSHVVNLLLQRGATVHACVRRLHDDARCGHLQRWARERPDQLHLFGADVLEPGSHDLAFQDCGDLIHTAARVRFSAKDPEREIVDVAVQGTQHVCESALSAGVRRVVMTSSVAAILSDDKPADYVFTEDDWCEDASVQTNAYALAKTESERFFWDFVEKHAERVTGVAINPSVVVGEVFAEHHIKGSNSIVRDILARKFPGCPAFHFDYVGVTDVVTAHVNALSRAEADGQRIILTHQGLFWRDVAGILQSRYHVTTRPLPNFLVYLAAAFDQRASIGLAKRLLSHRRRFRSDRARDWLGVETLPIESSVLAAADSMLRLGFVAARPR